MDKLCGPYVFGYLMLLLAVKFIFQIITISCLIIVIRWIHNIRWFYKFAWTAFRKKSKDQIGNSSRIREILTKRMIQLTLEPQLLFYITPFPTTSTLSFACPVKFRIADLLWKISPGSFELQTKFAFGGETASTGTKKLRLHTELLSAR